MRKVRSGGGWPAVRYAFKAARQAGGFRRFWAALKSPNACKTCALGMGGQRGGMVDESGHFPEVCKKSMQAMAADMQGAIAPEFFETYGFEALRQSSPRELEHLGRLTTPLIAGPDDTGYRPIAWDEALARCAERLRATTADDNFFYVSGRSSNEAAFLLQLFARLYGTNQINNCSYYCHQASGEGLKSAIGTGTATLTLEDLEACDLFFLIGGNPASNHPRLMRQLMHLRRRGGAVVVINPLVETGLVNFSVPSDIRSLLFGSPIASVYLQPHIGGDIALLCGIAKALFEMDAVDRSFLRQHTTGWESFAQYVQNLAWDGLTVASGVSAERIQQVARLYAASDHAVFSWTMGITHHAHGVDNVRAIANLALLRGMVGRPGCGLLPIRGHSNVQGVGSVGVTPALQRSFFERLESHFGVTLPRTAGLDTLSCLEGMATGTIRQAWCLGGNLFGASPDARGASKAFAGLDFAAYFSTTLNTGHAWGRARETVILPMRVRDEEDQRTTQESMFNYVRLSDGGAARHIGPRSEVAVIADLAHRVLGSTGPIDWTALVDHAALRRAIAAVVPGYRDIAHIEQRGEFHIAGRTLHAPRFATSDGRAHLHVTPVPAFDTPAGHFRLMTIRSEGQFNTVVYEEHDLYRHQDRRDVILMHADDIARCGLRPDQEVTVRSATGALHAIRVRPFAITPGNVAMYYPEANILVPLAADPLSRTPAFKHIPVEIDARRPDGRLPLDVV